MNTIFTRNEAEKETFFHAMGEQDGVKYEAYCILKDSEKILLNDEQINQTVTFRLTSSIHELEGAEV
jgi:hypothetical protein